MALNRAMRGKMNILITLMTTIATLLSKTSDKNPVVSGVIKILLTLVLLELAATALIQTIMEFNK